MSDSAVLKQLETALTPEQREFLEKKTIDRQMTMDQWLALLEACANFDTIGDKERGRATVITSISVVAALGGLVFSFTLPMVGVPILAVSGAFIAAFLPKYLKLKKLNIELDLKKFCLPVLRIVREDMPKDGLLRLKLDLRGCEIPEKKLQTQNLPAFGRYRNLQTTVYNDEWFSGDAVLRDGTRLRWQIVDTVESRSRTYTNARGKTKTKKKYKRKTDLAVQAKFPSTRYSVVYTARTDLAHKGLTVTSEGQTVKVYRQIKNAGGNAHTDLAPDQFIDTISQAFRRATPLAGSATGNQ